MDIQLLQNPPVERFQIPPGIESAGYRAYRWGWPLVNVAQRVAQARTWADDVTIILGGVPLSFGRLTMLTGYMSLEQRVIACPNQDTVYGAGAFDLSRGPIVFQVPDLTQQLYWSYGFYDARTDEFGKIGKQHGTTKGYFLLVGPNWDHVVPPDIPQQNVVESKTDLTLAVVRIFVKDPVAEQAAVVRMTSGIAFYPSAEYRPGRWKERDWSELRDTLPHLWAWRREEAEFVKPEPFFARDLPDVLDNVRPEPWEGGLYAEMREVVAYARAHIFEMRWFGNVAEGSVIAPLMAWTRNGEPAANNWRASSPDAGNWSGNYDQRAATAKSNMFESLSQSTRYFFTDIDSQGDPLNGRYKYEITFPPDQIPANYVGAFWSISLYDEYHFFNTRWNPVGQYSLGTKNGNDLKPDEKGLVLYAGGVSPGADKEKTWLPAEPDAPFSLYIRMYLPKPEVIQGKWKPPTVVKLP